MVGVAAEEPRGWRLPPAACLAIPAALGIAALAVLAGLAAGGWPGEPGRHGMVFCERSRAGLVRQPMNTWSNLAFVAVGLWIGARAWRERAAGPPRDPRNPMLSNALFPTLYASVAVLLGPASMALHATTTEWGGKLDVFCMYLWVAFVVAYALLRAADLSPPAFLATWAALVAVLGSVWLGDLLPAWGSAGSALFGVLLAVYAGLEAWISRVRRELRADRRLLVAAAAIFLVAFAIWVPSRTGGPLCAPDSLLQGHAIWHVLNAASVGALYAFYRSERWTPAAR
jgi:hypothetical protein